MIQRNQIFAIFITTIGVFFGLLSTTLAQPLPSECDPRTLYPTDAFRSFTNLTSGSGSLVTLESEDSGPNADDALNVPVFMIHEQALPELIHSGAIEVTESASDELMRRTQAQVSNVHRNGVVGVSGVLLDLGQIADFEHYGEAVLVVATRAESDSGVFAQSSDFFFMPGSFSIDFSEAEAEVMWFAHAVQLGIMDTPSSSLGPGDDKNCNCNPSLFLSGSVAGRSLSQNPGLPGVQPGVFDPCFNPQPAPDPQVTPNPIDEHFADLANNGFTTSDGIDLLHDRNLEWRYDSCREQIHPRDLYGRPITGWVDAGAYYNALQSEAFFVAGDVQYETRVPLHGTTPTPFCNVTDECSDSGGGECSDDSSTIERPPIRNHCGEEYVAIDQLCTVVEGPDTPQCATFNDYNVRTVEHCFGENAGGLLGNFSTLPGCEEAELRRRHCELMLVDGDSDECDPEEQDDQNQDRMQRIFDTRMIAFGCIDNEYFDSDEARGAIGVDPVVRPECTGPGSGCIERGGFRFCRDCSEGLGDCRETIKPVQEYDWDPTVEASSGQTASSTQPAEPATSSPSASVIDLPIAVIKVDPTLGAATERHEVSTTIDPTGAQEFALASGADTDIYPVTMSTGGVSFGEVDLEFIGPVRNLVFARTYSSKSDERGFLGSNWSHNWERRLIPIDAWNNPKWANEYCEGRAHCILTVNADGSRSLMILDPVRGVYVPENGGDSTLVLTDGKNEQSDKYIRRFADGRLEVYSLSGALIRDVDRFGNGFTVEQEPTPIAAFYTRYCTFNRPGNDESSEHAFDLLAQHIPAMPYNPAMCQRIKHALYRGPIDPLEGEGWDVLIEDLELPNLDGAATAQSSQALYGVYSWELASSLSGSNFAQLGTAPPELNEYYQKLQTGLAHIRELLNVDYGAKVMTGGSMYRVRRVVDDAGREFQFHYHDEPNGGFDGLLRYVDGPTGTKIDFNYERSPHAPDVVNETFLKSVTVRPSNASAAGAQGWEDQHWRQNGDVVRKSEYVYRHETGPLPDFELFRNSLEEFSSLMMGCRFFSPGDACAEKTVIEQDGNPCYHTEVQVAEAKSRLSDNIIEVWRSDGVDSVLRMATQYEEDIASLYFDRATQQHFGELSLQGYQSGEGSDSAVFEYLSAGPTSWTAALADASQHPFPEPSDDRTEGASGYASEFNLPIELKQLYPIETVNESNAPFRVNEHCESNGRCKTFQPDRLIFAPEPRLGTYQCNDDYRMQIDGKTENWFGAVGCYPPDTLSMMLAVPDSIPRYRYFESEQAVTVKDSVPRITRSLISCDRLAANQLNNIYSNDNVGRYVSEQPDGSLVLGLQPVLPQYTNDQRDRVEQDLKRVCSWTKVTERDGSVTFLGHNYMGLRLVEAVELGGDFRVVQRNYNADGLMTRETDPFLASGGIPQFELNGNPEGFTQLEYQSDRELPQDAYENGILVAGVVPQPMGWRKQKNLLRKTYFATPVHDVADLRDDWADTLQKSISTKQTIARIEDYKYEPFYNQLLRTSIRRDTIEDGLELLSTTEIFYDFSEFGSLQDMRGEFGYQNSTGANWPVDSSALEHWFIEEYPELFRGTDQDLNGDEKIGSYSSIDLITPVRGLPVQIVETEYKDRKTRTKVFGWTRNGQPMFERDYLGNQKNFYYYEPGTFGGPAPYSEAHTGFLARTETVGGPSANEDSDFIAESLGENPHLNGPYRFFGDPLGIHPSYQTQSLDTTLDSLNVPQGLRSGLTSMFEPKQKHRLFEYTAHGHLMSESVYTHNSSDPIAKSTWVTDLDGRILESTENGVRTVRQLNSKGRVENATTFDENGLMIGFQAFRYNSRGQVTAHCTAASNNGCQGVWSETADPLDHTQATTRLVYDEMDRLSQIRDAEGNWTTYEYDSLGRPITSITPQKDENGFVQGTLIVDHGYDLFDRLTMSSSSDNGNNPRTTYYEYDSLGRLQAVTDPLNNQFQLAYDKFGNQVLDVATNLPITGGFTFGANENFILQQYDGFGHVIRENRHNLQIAEFGVRKDGLPWKVWVEGEGTAYVRYDWEDKPVWQLMPDGTQRVFAFDYVQGANSFAQLQTTEMVVPAGANPTTSARSQLYDPRARVLSQTSYSHDGLLDVSTAMSYQGTQAAYIDRDGKLHEYEMDLMGRIFAVTKPDAGGLTNLTQFNTISSGGRILSSTSEQGEVTSYQYDSFGNIVRRTLPSGLAQTWKYNVFGAPILTENGCDVSRAFDYTSSGLLSEVSVEESGNSQTIATFSHDSFGRVTSATRHNLVGQATGIASASIGYDHLGRTTSLVHGFDSEPALVQQFQYEHFGSQTIVTNELPHGVDLRSTSQNTKTQSIDRVLGGQDDWTSSFAWSGNTVTNVDTFFGVHAIFNETREYDRRNNLSSWSYGVGTTELAFADIQRDKKDRIRGVQYDFGSANTQPEFGGGNTRFWEGYSYDHRNALTAIHFDTGDLGNLGDPHVLDNAVMAQLTGLTSGRERDPLVADLLAIDGADIYGGQDPNAVWWESRDSNNAIGRDAGHRIHNVTIDGVNTTLGYSCDGQIVEAMGLSFEYDNFGRLIRVSQNGSELERYYYGPLGHLVAYENGTGVQRFIYDGDQMVASYEDADHDGNAWVSARWEAVWGPGQDQLLTFFDHNHSGEPARVLNVMRDHRNSVVGAYDDVAQAVVGRAHYSAEGRLMTFDTDTSSFGTSDINNLDCQEIGSYDGVCAAPGGIPFAFNSMWRSPVTGLVYMRNRVYSPRLGQFLSHDPLGYVDSYNLYQFAAFDPINNWDPYGLNVFDDIDDALTAHVVEPMKDAVNAKSDFAKELGGSVHQATGALLDAAGVESESIRQVVQAGAATLTEVGAEVGGSVVLVGPELVVAVNESGSDMAEGAQEVKDAETTEDVLLGGAKIAGGVGKAAGASVTFVGAGRGSGAGKTKPRTPDVKKSPSPKTSTEVSNKTTTNQSRADATQNKSNRSGKQEPGGCFAAGTPVVVGDEIIPIEEVEVGQRVSQYHDGVCDHLPDPDPETCVVVELELDEPTHASKRLRATLMRDAAWLKANVKNGRIWLGFDEINAEGWSRIESVSSCPVTEPGEGCLVTGTFTHLNDDVMALRFEELEETVHVTSLHPLYSLDRGQWLNVRDIENGERLASKSEGWLTVSSLEPLHESMQVFNIEVQGDHEYLVYREGLRSHNADKCKLSDPLPDPLRRKNAKPIREAYEDMKEGTTHPRIDPDTNQQKTYQARELGPGNNVWKDAKEYDVLDAAGNKTDHRLLERKDGAWGYVYKHDYKTPRKFPAPWYKE